MLVARLPTQTAYGIYPAPYCCSPIPESSFGWTATMSRKKGTVKYKHAGKSSCSQNFFQQKSFLTKTSCGSHFECFSAKGIHFGCQQGEHCIMLRIHQLIPQLLHKPRAPKNKIQSWRFSQHTTFSAPNPPPRCKHELLSKEVSTSARCSSRNDVLFQMARWRCEFLIKKPILSRQKCTKTAIVFQPIC